MKKYLTTKQSVFLRTTVLSAVVILAFRYLIPLLLPFIIAVLLSILIRPAVRFLYKWFHVPMGAGATIVLTLVLVVLTIGGFRLGKVVVEQLVQLVKCLPEMWTQFSQWLWDCCGRAETSLGLEEGAITARLSSLLEKGGNAAGAAGGKRFVPGEGTDSTLALLGDQLGTWITGSLQGIVSVGKTLITAMVTIFITIGATIITTTQLEPLKQAVDRSLFGQEIRCMLELLARVGTAYGKTQLVIMGCTMVISAVGLTILGDPYALLWAAVIGVVDALPIFGAGTILWPWMVISLLRKRWSQAVGLALIYAASNLTRQWLEARYMGDRIGVSPLENLLAMYVGLKLFGILGLFLGPIGYLLIKEGGRGAVEGPVQ